ncbi:hypothetical protein KBD33_04470 [Candidatus Gracilibacteria bacterium]|nr:hypothetical protein [Candidatus Gracilibacteria bacterium]
MSVQFLYIIENLYLYSPDIVHVIIAIVIGIILPIVLRYTYLYSIGYAILWREKRMLQNKKNILSDLILMKDIQSEMEKEIEQATLKATFQG